MDTFISAWDSVCDFCRKQMTETAFSAFIKGLTPVRLDEGAAYFSVRTKFQKELIENHYLDLIKKGFENVFGFVPGIVISELEEQAPVTVGADGVKPVNSMPPYPGAEPHGVTSEYTFDSFVIGPSNKFAFSVCHAVADAINEPKNEYNPLFLYGPSGLGKTHLLYAISTKISKEHPKLDIVYIKGDDFTNGLIAAIHNNTTMEFREKYRKADVFLVDDIQFLAGKEATQVEFFHTFETLFQAGKQIVLTSDRPPKEIETIDDRLRNRFESGVFADISLPDIETRMAIVTKKAESLGIDLNLDIIRFIAEKVTKNIRQLEGSVKKIKAYNMLSGDKVSIAIASSAIRDVLSDSQPIPVTVDRIMTEISRTYGVTQKELQSPNRAGNVSAARQVAIHIVREITGMSLTNIGKEFGGRNHATIVYSLREVERRAEQDPSFRAQINDLIKNIRDN